MIDKKAGCDIISKIETLEQKLDNAKNFKWIIESTLKILEKIGERRTSTSEDKNGNG